MSLAQQIVTLSLEVVWHVRFELIFAALTFGCFFFGKFGTHLFNTQQAGSRGELHVRPKSQARAPKEKKLETRVSKTASEPHKIKSDRICDPHKVKGDRLEVRHSDAVLPRKGPAEQSRSGGEVRHDRSIARQASRMILVESRRDRGQPLEMHQDALAGGTRFGLLPRDEAHRLYLALALAALREEQAEAVVPLLQGMARQQIEVPPLMLALVIKRCAQRRLFSACLASYGVAHAAEGSPPRIEDAEFWSSLLLSAVETGSFSQCAAFWCSAKANGVPTARDYSCMVRFAAHRGSWEETLRIVEEMHANGHAIESAICSIAIGTCVAAQQIGVGERILNLVERDGLMAADVAIYNMLMKAYASADDVNEVLRLHARMRERGVRPTQVTFGIILDSCVNRGNLEHAAKIFEDMSASGCTMNTVLYTTLIKGLARAGRVDDAMGVYQNMQQTRVRPDTILFSVLIKANCDAGRMEVALHLFESMAEHGHRPDEIVFNTLLAGCARESNLTLGRRLLDEMARSGVRPSHATASVLIKLYAKCRLLDEAQQLLQKMPEELGLVPEPRLFVQLVHASIRERQGKRAVEVFRAMASVARPDASAASGVVGACLGFNMVETARELLEAAREAGVEDLECDQLAVQQAAERRSNNLEKKQAAASPYPAFECGPPATAPVPIFAQRPAKNRSWYCGP